MKDLRLNKLAELFDQSFENDPLIQGVSVDSRLVEEGDLFVCLPGERVDGHDFAEEALRKGAQALLVERKLDLDVPQIQASDSEKALIDLAKWYRNQMTETQFIAITGSNGKTSTKDILSAVLSQNYKSYATYKNQNTQIGTSLNLFSMDGDEDFGVFEMGLDESGDIERMREMVKPDYVVLTSLSPAHIVNFSSVEEIAREKMLIAEGLPSNRVFFQGDFDLYFDGLPSCVSYGQKSRNQHQFTDVQIYKEKTSFRLDGKSYSTNLVGAHQASNASAAILILRDLGLSEEEIEKGLMKVSLTEMRMQKIRYGEMEVLFDAYKSNLDSLKYALDYFSLYAKGERQVAILSEMVELGDLEKKSHLKSVEYLEELPFEKVYLIGEAFENIRDQLDAAKYEIVDSIEALQTITQNLAKENVFLFVKGSRSYALERIFKERIG